MNLIKRSKEFLRWRYTDRGFTVSKIYHRGSGHYDVHFKGERQGPKGLDHVTCNQPKLKELR